METTSSTKKRKFLITQLFMQLLMLCWKMEIIFMLKKRNLVIFLLYRTRVLLQLIVKEEHKDQRGTVPS